MKAFNKISRVLFYLPDGSTVNFLSPENADAGETPCVDMPIEEENILDETLDTAKITLSDMRQSAYPKIDVSEPFEPRSKIEVYYEGQEYVTKMIVAHDDVRMTRKDDHKAYEHKIQLVEQTKNMEFDPVDTLTFCNPVERKIDYQGYASWGYEG